MDRVPTGGKHQSFHTRLPSPGLHQSQQLRLAFPLGGGRITDARLVLTPRGALTVCQTVTVTLNSVSMMDLLRVQPRVSGYSFPPQDSIGS